MIRLTGKSGLAIYVNPDKIIGFIEDVYNGGTFINYKYRHKKAPVFRHGSELWQEFDFSIKPTSTSRKNATCDRW